MYSFAHISPTFTFKELDIHNHFGRVDELSESIGRHYITSLLCQSYKLFSIHLLGDPFSLLNSITMGAVQFITITKDEVLSGGKHGVGGGVKKLVQGVVGGTSRSTAMAFGSGECMHCKKGDSKIFHNTVLTFMFYLRAIQIQLRTY